MCPTDSSSPIAPQVDTHPGNPVRTKASSPLRSLEAQRSSEGQRSGSAEPTPAELPALIASPRGPFPAAFPSALCVHALRSPGPQRRVAPRSAPPRQGARAKLEVPGGASRPPGGFRFFLSGEGKITQPCLFPQSARRGARHMDISRSASVSFVAFSVDVCVCVCVCLRPARWEQTCIC